MIVSIVIPGKNVLLMDTVSLECTTVFHTACHHKIYIIEFRVQRVHISELSMYGSSQEENGDSTTNSHWLHK